LNDDEYEPKHHTMADWNSFIKEIESHPDYRGNVQAVVDEYQGISLKTTAAVPPGGTILQIPFDYCLSAEDCRALTEKIRKMWEEPLVPERACFMWYIASLKDQFMNGVNGANARGVKYVGTIIDVNQSGCSWGVDEMIEGTNLADSVNRMNEDAEVWYGRIKEVMTGLGEDVVKWETWKWANGVYHSRGFPSDILGVKSKNEGNDYCGCLVPVLDLTNHQPEAEVEWLSAERGVEMRAGPKGLAAGAEISNNYGQKSNTQLYRSYGFTIPLNPYDTYPLLLSYNSPSSGRVVTLGPFEIRKNDERWEQFPSGLWRAMEDPVGCEGGVNDDCQDGQVEVDGSTIQGLSELLQSRLAAFEATRERDDEVYGKNGEGDGGKRGWYGAIYRIGQREVLEDALDTLNAMLMQYGEEEEEEEETAAKKMRY